MESARTDRALVWAAWAFIAAQFLPWSMVSGQGAHGFFVPGSYGSGWYGYFTDLAVVLPFGIAALIRLRDVFPRGRLVIPELALAVAFVTAVRIVLPYIQASSAFDAPAIGTFVGAALALVLVVVAFRSRADRTA